MKNENAAVAAERIKEELSEILGSYLFKPVNEDTIRRMSEEVSNRLKIPENPNRLSFDFSKNPDRHNEVIVSPKNIFSLITMAALETPPGFLIPETGHYRGTAADYSVTVSMSDGKEIYNGEIH